MEQKNKVLKIIQNCGILPTAFIHSTETAVPLARILWESGIPVVEVLQRSREAAWAVPAIKKALPDMLVGAGTILDLETAREMKRQGADFLVLPQYQPEIVEWCREQEMPVVPGCGTMTEIGAAYRQGLRYVKFFPANQLGGTEALRQFGEIYPDMRFIPTGGLTLQEAKNYFRCPWVAAVGGVFMMPEKAVRQQEWEEVRRACSQAMFASLGLELNYWNTGKTTEIGFTAWSLERAEYFLRQKGFSGVHITGGVDGDGKEIQACAGGYTLRIVCNHERQ